MLDHGDCSNSCNLRELSISVSLQTDPRGACRPSREPLRVLVSLQQSTYPRPTSAKPVLSVSREERLPLVPYLELSCIRRDSPHAKPKRQRRMLRHGPGTLARSER